MKYIEAEKLIAEIERWRDKAKEKYNESTYSMGRCDALAEFRNHIVSLQQEQPEVDLDELINDFLLNNSEFLVERDSKVVVQKLARHFYELGFNTKKEE